ncbi:hypothetical protein V6N12_072057 [Hibiscus sabdariffa]|uniref:Pentatricopeptide repeat-containing protein n=1 Tax=Hibiscus sabdariffa TaxID=183260 RepID=A0ABR2FM16_9ROSI
MKVRNIPPNVYTFAITINALCKENRLHEARELLRELKCTSIVPKPFIFNPVIDGFCKSGDLDEANLIVVEMEEKKCYPDKVTFTILIIGHCMKGRMLDAIGIFNKMLSVGCTPDCVTVNSLASLLFKAGMPIEASRKSSPSLNLVSYCDVEKVLRHAQSTQSTISTLKHKLPSILRADKHFSSYWWKPQWYSVTVSYIFMRAL